MIARWGVKDVFGQFLILIISVITFGYWNRVFDAHARLWRNLAQTIPF